jgi:GH43 family beta-xylosidase
MTSNKPRLITPYTGTKLNAKGWIQEAALRMLMNNLNKVALKTRKNLSYMAELERLPAIGKHMIELLKPCFNWKMMKLY